MTQSKGKFYSICPHCEERTPRDKFGPTRRTCNKKKCKKKQIQKDLEDRRDSRRRSAARDKEIDEQQKIKVVHNGRFCRRCEETKGIKTKLYHNYFFCNSCLSIMSDRLPDAENPYYMCEEKD